MMENVHFCVCIPPCSWSVEHVIIKKVVCHHVLVSLDAILCKTQNSFQETPEVVPVSVLKSEDFFKRDFKLKEIKQALKSAL